VVQEEQVVAEKAELLQLQVQMVSVAGVVVEITLDQIILVPLAEVV
jgi:hypothetical protein